MITARIDRAQLERSLKRFASAFGETNSQAVIRWSVNACRELAFETQVYGKSKTRQKQEGAIIAGAYQVLLVVDSLVSTRRGYKATNQGIVYYVSRDKACLSIEDINEWIDSNRNRRNGRTHKLEIHERKVCSKAIFKKAMKERYKKAGLAKGGWIGAGLEIARAQTGQEKIAIGKNYLSYAHKHARYGSAKKPASGWRPFAEITNKVAYSNNRNVLSPNAPAKAFAWSLKKTIKWYQSALRVIDRTRTR